MNEEDLDWTPPVGDPIDYTIYYTCGPLTNPYTDVHYTVRKWYSLTMGTVSYRLESSKGLVRMFYSFEEMVIFLYSP